MIDRFTVRRQVEDFWRSLLLQGRQQGEAHPKMDRDELWHLSQELSRNLSRRFEECNQATAAAMPPDEARAFLVSRVTDSDGSSHRIAARGGKLQREPQPVILNDSRH